MQEVAPELLYFPAAQRTHSPVPAYLPAVHCEHPPEPVEALDPAGQLVHAVLPWPFAKVSTGQDVQVLKPAVPAISP